MSATSTTESPPKDNPVSGETSGTISQITMNNYTDSSTHNRIPRLCADGLPPIMSAEEFRAADFKDDRCDECGGVMSECHCYDDDNGLTDDQQAGYQEWIGQIRKNALEGWDESIQKIAREISSDPIARHTLQIFQRLDESKRTQLKGWLVAGGLEEEDLEDFPAIIPLDEFMEQDIPERKVLIVGILKKESKLVLSGQSKPGKTFVMMSLAMAIVNGGEWLGFKCHKGTVLYVNLELHKDSTQQRFNMLKDQFGGFKGIDLLPLRGYAAPMDKIAARIKQRIKESGKDFDLIIIDPIYKTYGDTDENSAGDITKLMNQLDGVGLDTQTSIAFVHHDTKTGTRLSGSGVFARDPDAIISLQMVDQNEPTSDIMVKMELRDFAPVESFTVSREGFVFSRTAPPPVKLKPSVQHAIKIVKMLEDSLHGSMRRVDMERTMAGTLSSKKFDDGFKVCTDNGWISKGSKSTEYSIAPLGNEMLFELKSGKNPNADVMGKFEGKRELIHEG